MFNKVERLIRKAKNELVVDFKGIPFGKIVSKLQEMGFELVEEETGCLFGCSELHITLRKDAETFILYLDVASFESSLEYVDYDYNSRG